ncbi:hypothetical protein B296_00022059 [Ensete ventricosum]|uniref:Uncharacterized protein n=1 Tax=Ensete ventricosum TaxID=4639 RepID=A0A426Z0Y0_ENSVE|nr:hypothetical protein B296_00022059 [Ensete ventricosum]
MDGSHNALLTQPHPEPVSGYSRAGTDKNSFKVEGLEAGSCTPAPSAFSHRRIPKGPLVIVLLQPPRVQWVKSQIVPDTKPGFHQCPLDNGLNDSFAS